ncbi:ankyrin 2,3/unc44 [Sclerotinia borealis F-4128]|uniref:Ankyrin 2,3/unc44 n=1 Tax=Sclerotinia borealis (strain F-4128) TaxID=1432307 RepID=W9CEP6_SCLBF|nr:ankyrin 2,3/unc44 [Sclerotinia borealis F-4128]
MDPLTAIGLASAVIQFIDFGLKIAARLNDLNRSNSSQIPKSLQAISTQLPLLVSSLGRMKTHSQINHLDFDSKCILRGVVAGCTAQIEKIEDIIDKISAVPGDAFKVKIRKVFVGLRCDEKVWEIERNLQTYISVLVLHHVVDATAAMPLIVEDSFSDVREKRVVPFVERPDLIKELEDFFYKTTRSQAQEPTFVLVHGNKGVGKTQLVLKYCHQAHALGQFQTVFWI